MSIRFSAGWLLLVSSFIFSAHTNKAMVVTEPNALSKAYTMIEQGQCLLQEGDLVLRLNHDPASQFIKHFNRDDKSYSHAGIVLFEKGYPYVYHIVNGDENPGEQIKKDSLPRYCNPRNNFGFGIYRYNIDSAEVRKLKAVIYGWQKTGISFDHNFDLKTDNRMYCSEMITKALAKATVNRIKIATTQPSAIEAAALSPYIHLSLSETKKLQLIAIDNLYSNKNCSPVFSYNF